LDLDKERRETALKDSEKELNDDHKNLIRFVENANIK